MRSMAIEVIEKDDIPGYFNKRGLGEGPVVFRGVAKTWPATTALNLRNLKTAFGHVMIPIRKTDDEFAEFAEVHRNNDKPRMMMKLADYIDRISGPSYEESRPPYAGNISIQNDPAVAHRLGQMVSSCRFPALSEVCSREEYRLWIGAAGQRSTIHNDPYNNFNAQIAGRKYFLLFPPEEHRKLHARFFHEGMWASPIDPKRPDIVRFPEFADLRAYEHELSEGDILYIPRFWWHYVEGITPCVNVNRWIFSEATKGEWWHQQPSAKENIRFGELVEQISNEFLALPLELQEIRREDFEALRLELERFAKEQRMGTA